ncbi:gasdermin-E-like [Liolophura sinensis]|uniref:gasdermin-E-like n=1 Tax=Liolophura sinensis TaxID=3198878 RepID=UPI00315902C8
MFSTAVSHFVKAVGKDSFIPVPSLDVADNVKLLQVVVKKNRYWFWQKPSYLPTDFSLNDLLKDNGNVSLPAKGELLVGDYNPSYSISVNGKFGAALCKELIHVEVDADDEVKLDVNFGDVDKYEVNNIPKLLKELESVHLDLNHPYVKQVQKNSYKTLCLIVGVAKLTKDSELHSELKLDNGAEANMAMASGRARLSVDDDKTKKFTIPKGTAIAYNVCELMISRSGEIQLVVVEGLHGGFGAEDDVDSPRNPVLPATDESSVLLFKGILSMSKEERQTFTDNILEILATPRLIEPILMQLKAAYRTVNHVRNSRCDISINSLRRSIVSKKDTWKEVLATAGFEFKDDEKVSYPTENDEKLESCRGLFKALIELDDDEIAALRRCNASLATPLDNLLHDVILKKPGIKKDSERYSPIFEKGCAALDLLKELGFKITDNAVEPPRENQYSLQAAQRVIFALWGTTKM